MQTEIFPPDDVKPLPDGAVILREFGQLYFAGLWPALDDVLAQAPPRNMTTPGGHRMSVAMTSCGDFGWVSGPDGYAYSDRDPLTGRRWPQMPDVLMALAQDSASRAGYPFFTPDTCLINLYVPGTRLSRHQDRNERDFAHPIVSLSLGLPATFEFGGLKRSDPVQLIRMRHSDVLVWGGPSRLAFHGVRTIRKGRHPDLGAQRINLTFRRSQ